MHDSRTSVTKAVIPVAGYGTRRLPITKAIEKCMLPVCNRPIVDYTVEACIAAGITDIIFVVAPDYSQLATYYSPNTKLEQYLTERYRTAELDLIATTPSQVRFEYVIQDPAGAYGTAVPVWLARDHVGPDEQFLVLMGDDFIYNPSDPGADLRKLCLTANRHRSAGLLTVEVDDQSISRYAAIETDSREDQEWFVRLTEKPEPGTALSNLANVSKYLLDYSIFDYISQVMKTPNDAGEFYLTDAVNDFVRDGHGMFVNRAEGRYLDGGNLDSWIQANTIVHEFMKSGQLKR